MLYIYQIITFNGFLMDSFRELDAQFDLVMILERFEESLILLQELMCWPTEDLVYLKHNERVSQGGFTTLYASASSQTTFLGPQ